MKCRHCDTPWEHDWEYCPECERNYGGAKYPATQTDEERREIGLLLGQIRTAFAGVVLGGGETIHQAHLEGTSSRGAPKWIAEGEKDPETDWSEVPDWKLEQGFSTLCFFDVEGWRFYLPAFMCWSLRNWRTTDFLTADALVWNLTFEKWGIPLNCAGRLESLNRQQSEAAYAFLDLLDRYSGESRCRRGHPFVLASIQEGLTGPRMELPSLRKSYLSERSFGRLVPVNSTVSRCPIHNTLGKFQAWIGIGAICTHPAGARFVESYPEPETIPPWLRTERHSSRVCGRQSLPKRV